MTAAQLTAIYESSAPASHLAGLECLFLTAYLQAGGTLTPGSSPYGAYYNCMPGVMTAPTGYPVLTRPDLR